MTESQRPDGNEQSAGSRDIQAVAQQFESAWREVERGASPPTIEAFLADIAEPERSAIRQVLCRIDSRYRQKSPEEHARDDTELQADGPTKAERSRPSPPGAVDHVPAEPPGVAGTLSYVHAEGKDQEGHAAATAAGLPKVPGYEILGELGRGAMGVVYQARQVGLKRLVALKMILTGRHAAPGELARFQTEAEAVAQLQHPNVVQVYEVGQHDGVPYFSMEFVDGESLQRKLRGKPLEAEEAATLTEILAQSIHHAHQQGVVHRDLKPGNVLLTSDGVPKISDFGLAKRLEDDSGQTRTGSIMGTPSYMAPEQARGEVKQVGPLADVYALGAVCYEMLTGRPPFVAANPVDTVRQVLEQEPVAPRRLQPKVPRDLETICLKCLQKAPGQRYADALALAEDLRRFREGRPIQARPVGATERVWRWCRRNPRVALPTAAAMLLAVTLMIGGPIATMVIYQQKEIAVAARREAQINESRANHAKENALAAERDAIQARDEAQHNEQKAREAQALAATQGRLALDTLKTLVSEVQTELENRPRLQSLRRRLLKKALGGLDLVATRGLDVRYKDVTMAGAYRRMGDIYLELGQSEKALKQYLSCHAILEQLDAEGTLPNAHHNLSFSFANLGEAARRAGDPSKAKQYFLESLNVRRQWAKLKPADKPIRQSVAESLGRLGSVCLMMGQLQEAHEFYQESLQLRRQWLDLEPKNPQAQRELAGAQSAMGKLRLKLGDLAAAEQHSQTALQMLSQLCESQPNDRTGLWNLALFSSQLGTVRLMACKAEQSAEDYAQALPILQKLSEDDPQNALLRRHLAEAHYGIATAYLRLDNPAAASHYEMSLELREQLVADDPTSAAEQTGLMLSLGRCGRYQEAAEIADRLRESQSGNAHVLYYVATGYAICAAAAARHRDAETTPSDAAARSEELGRTAVETLRSAVENGYQVTAELTLDPDLDGIRQRADFQELLRLHEGSVADSRAAP